MKKIKYEKIIYILIIISILFSCFFFSNYRIKNRTDKYTRTIINLTDNNTKLTNRNKELTKLNNSARKNIEDLKRQYTELTNRNTKIKRIITELTTNTLSAEEQIQTIISNLQKIIDAIDNL